MENKILKGKVAFISGGGTGIGAASARRFVELGATVGIAGRRLDVLEKLADEIGCTPLQCDVTSTESVNSAISTLVEGAGGLNIVVNNAGSPDRGLGEEIEDDYWMQSLDVNINGVLRVARASLPHLKHAGGGAIVNVASVGGIVSGPDMTPYSTAKAAVIGLTRALAVDYGQFGIRVNTLCPGFVDTPMTEPLVQLVGDAHGVSKDEAFEMLAENSASKKFATADEMARCVEFLATDASIAVNAATLVADNGQTAMDIGMVPVRSAFKAMAAAEAK